MNFNQLKYKVNREKILGNSKKYYLENKEMVLAKAKAKRKKIKDAKKLIAASKRYYWGNREIILAKLKSRRKVIRDAKKLEVVSDD